MSSSKSLERSQALLCDLVRILHNEDQDKNSQVQQEAIRISSLLTASLKNAETLAFETCFLPAYSACCRASIHLGLFDAIINHQGSITAGDLAAKVNTEPLLVVRLLRVATGLGLVSEDGIETYSAVPATYALTSPMIKAAHQHFWDQGTASLLHFPQYLSEHGSRCPTDARDGMFQYAYTTELDAFSYWQSRPEPRTAFDNFNFLMTCIRGKEPSWLSWYPLSERILQGARAGKVLLVDVGGGRGHDILAFQRRVVEHLGESVRLVLQDLPAILSESNEVEAVGIEKLAYDFFTPQVVKGARIYYYAHILHDWSDKACRSILRNAKLGMERGYSKILLYEFILPDVGCPLIQAGFDLQMMGMHAGMERTRAQWTTLIQAEGLRIIQFWEAPNKEAEGVIEIELQ